MSVVDYKKILKNEMRIIIGLMSLFMVTGCTSITYKNGMKYETLYEGGKAVSRTIRPGVEVRVDRDAFLRGDEVRYVVTFPTKAMITKHPTSIDTSVHGLPWLTREDLEAAVRPVSGLRVIEFSDVVGTDGRRFVTGIVEFDDWNKVYPSRFGETLQLDQIEEEQQAKEEAREEEANKEISKKEKKRRRLLEVLGEPYRSWSGSVSRTF